MTKLILAYASRAALFIGFFGSFLVAEPNAYAPGHNGFIYSPWGVLGLVVCLVIGFWVWPWSENIIEKNSHGRHDS